MANFQNNLHMFLFLIVALTACLKNQITEGRQVKAILKEHYQFTSVKMGTRLQIHARKVIQEPGNSAVHRQIPPPTPNHHKEKSNNSDIFHSKDSESTTPGNSPGIGHHFAVQKHNMQDFSSVANQMDDYKGPGHSPGVGHSSKQNP